MSKKQEVKIFLDEKKNLWVHTVDGSEYWLSIFNGGGYYTDFMLQTEQEIAANEVARKAREAKYLSDQRARQDARESKKWWQLW